MTQIELAERYAQAQGGAAAWFAPARDTCDLLAKIALIGPADHLIVYADDAEDAFRARFSTGALTFISAPTPEAFLAASEVPLDSESPAALEGPALAVEGSPASYAYPAGRSARRIFWFTASIGGMGLRVPDIRALAVAARVAGALLIVDNTVPSCFGCHPLELGAHLCLEALDRVAAGALARKVVAASVARPVQRRRRRHVVDPRAEDARRLITLGLGPAEAPGPGACLADEDVRIIAAGLDSLPARMQAHADHARALAAYLSCHYQVGRVCYPGLNAHPDHEVAARTLLHGFGPAVDFSLLGDDRERPAARAARLIASCSCANRQASPGGHLTRLSLVERADVAYVRMFAGTDDPLSITDSLDQALRLFCNPPEP